MKCNILCLMIVLVAVVGCGEKSPTVRLSGVVKLDGQPLPYASVQFVSGGTDGRDAMGTCDDQGKFTLSTFVAGDGALPGDYKVVVTPGAAPQEGAGTTADEAMVAAAVQTKNPAMANFPEVYTRPDKTPLKQSVPAQGEVVIELKGK